MTDARPATDSPNSLPDARVLPGDGGAQTSPSVAGCSVFPANDPWNQPIPPNAAIDATWTQKLIRQCHQNLLHPDFGTTFGIPYNVVPANQAKLPITFDYSDDSDPGPYPFPRPARRSKAEYRPLAAVTATSSLSCKGPCSTKVGIVTTIPGVTPGTAGAVQRSISARSARVSAPAPGHRPTQPGSPSYPGSRATTRLPEEPSSTPFVSRCTARKTALSPPASHQAVPTGPNGCPMNVPLATEYPPTGPCIVSRPVTRLTRFPLRPRSSRKR